MINVALHIEHRHAAGFGDCIEVAVADAPIHVADGDPVVIASKNFSNFLGRIAVGDLGRFALDECSVPAQLGHAGLE